MLRVSIFMSVFDVHINRTHVAGILRKLVYIPGKFVNADLNKASEANERQHFVVERADGVRVGFNLNAGQCRMRVAQGKSMSVCVTPGSRRIIKPKQKTTKKKQTTQQY